MGKQIILPDPKPGKIRDQVEIKGHITTPRQKVPKPRRDPKVKTKKPKLSPKKVDWRKGIAEYDQQVRDAQKQERADKKARTAYLKKRLKKHTQKRLDDKAE